jgi:hypothetical protein
MISKHLFAAACLVALTTTSLQAATIHVSPRGNDEGQGTPASPFASLQKALAAAQPGDTIELAPGRYLQDARTVRDGAPGRPIVIKGPADAIVSGAGAPRIFEVNHDHIELHGFTLDGRHTAPESKASYRDKLLYVIGTKPGDGVTGLKVFNMQFRNGGGECLRMRYFAQRNEVAHSSFTNCGVYDYRFKGGGKNGEAIYIGTAPEQLGQWGAPDKAVDQSDGNWIHHNLMNTQGNECVDIKEGSSANIVERNQCTGQRDTESAGLDSRGSGNVLRFNTVANGAGAGIRLGGDGPNDGINNDVYGNTLKGNRNGGLRVQRGPQGKICENILANNTGGPAVGPHGKGMDPTVPCDAQVASADGRAAAARAASAHASKSSENKGSIRSRAPALSCAATGVHCVVARIEGDDRSRIKILDASDTALRGKHLVMRDAMGASGPADLKALAGKTVTVEFDGLEKKVLQKARVIDVVHN